MVALHVLSADSVGLPADIDDRAFVLALPPGAILTDEARTLIEQLVDPPAALFGDIELDGVVRYRAAWSPTRAITDPTSVLPLVVRAGTLRSLELDPADPGVALALSAAGIEPAHVPLVITSQPIAPVAPSASQLSHHLQTVAMPASPQPASRPATFRIVPDDNFSPRITIVIPTAGTRLPRQDATTEPTTAIDQCLASLAGAGDGVDVVLVVGDEYRGDPRTIAVPEGLRTTIVTRAPGAFDFSLACNLGLLASSAELVLFLNDDISASGPGFLRTMAIHLTDPDIGAVGAELHYPGGTIQHTGVIIDDARPLHPFVGRLPGELGADGADIARDVVAVTGACLMARRADLLAVGGLSRDFPMSFNDVDLCIRLRRFGRRVVIEPAATLVHHETLSREPTISSWEWDRWIHRWGDMVDPWYHPAFHRPDDPAHLRRNVDHLPPRVDDLTRLRHEPVSVRTPRLRSRVHRGRPAPSVD